MQRNRYGSAQWLLISLLLGTLLSACASKPPGGVQVIDRNGRTTSQVAQRQPATSGQYVVQRGDTLYSIAFRFGWDWKTLAARNGIPAPYLIRSGQIIRFGGSPAVAQARSPASVARPTPAPAVSSGSSAPVRPVHNQAPVKPVPAVTPIVSSPRSAAGWGWPSRGG